MTAHIIISGYVQGVGYRQFVKNNAKQLGLTGWVKNLPDKRVEAMIQGEKETIEKLLVECEKGSMFSEVNAVTTSWITNKELFREFIITH